MSSSAASASKSWWIRARAKKGTHTAASATFFNFSFLRSGLRAISGNSSLWSDLIRGVFRPAVNMHAARMQQLLFPEWLSRSEVCPVDRQALTAASLTRVRMAERLIEKLAVRCTHHCQCAWEGPLSARAGHLNTSCAHADVGCSLDGCTVEVERRGLATHEAACEHRIVPCQHCSRTMPARALEAHYTVCAMIEVECPRNCGARPLRGAVLAHVQSCPRAEIVCPHTGCTERVQRADAPAHAAQCEHCAVACQHCSLATTTRSLEEHHAVCDRVQVACLRSCGARVARGEVGNHGDSCPLMPMPCPFAPHGCATELVRQDCSAHQAGCATEHAELVAARVERMSALLSTTTSVLEAQVGKVNKLECELRKQQGALTIEWEAVAALAQIERAPELHADAAELDSACFTVEPIPGRGRYEMQLQLEFSQEKGVGCYLYHRGGGVEGQPLKVGGTTLSLVAGAGAGAGDQDDARGITAAFTAGDEIEWCNGLGVTDFVTLGQARALAKHDGSLHVRAAIRIAPVMFTTVGMLEHTLAQSS